MPGLNSDLMQAEGYVNSQSWEAWADCVQVLWDNTETIFVVSLLLSVAAVLVTWVKYPKALNVKTERPVDNNGIPAIFEEPDASLETIAAEEHNDSRNEVATHDDEDDDTARPAVVVKGSSSLAIKQLTREYARRMSDDDRRKEREAQNEQLAAIFQLMKEQEDKFGDTSIDDVKNQMKFYCG